MSLFELHEYIKDIATRHQAVAEFRSGVEQSFDDVTNEYPLVFLERDFMTTLSAASETERYSIRITVADKLSATATDTQVVQQLSKVHQIAKQLHYKLKKDAKQAAVAPFTIVLGEERYTDLVVTARMEFTLDTGAGVALRDNVFN